MALVAPSNLLAQLLEPLIVVEQSVEREVAAGPLIELTQVVDDSATLVPVTTLVGLTMVVDDDAVIVPAQTLVEFTQVVDDLAVLVPAATLVTLEQEVVTLVEVPRQSLIALEQEVEREVAARRLVRLRQIIEDVAAPQPRRHFVFLDGVDITCDCARDLSVTATEGDNRTCRIIYRPPKGPINITSFQGRELEIWRVIDGTLTPLFIGVVDVPTYDRPNASITLRGSDLRNERIGREDQAHLQQITGGLYSPVTQQEDAEGERWVRELMRTVPGSLDYTSAGTLRYNPWALGTPRYTLESCDIHYNGVALEFATRSEIVNRISATVEYRWYQRRTLQHTVSAQMRRSRYGSGVSGVGSKLPYPGDVIPSRDALIGAVQGVGGWQTVSYTVAALPDSGWYRDPLNLQAGPIGWQANPVVQATKGMGITARLEKYISQPKRETYELIIQAPQSIDQFGEIDGSPITASLESRIDPSVFEERGCSVGPEDDRRADLNLAIEVVQAMAQRELLAAHRKNYAEFRSRRDLLPVEIGDTISVASTSIQVASNVTEFTHTISPNGDDYTSIKLAVSRVDSAVVVTEDWALPAVPSKYKLNAESQALPETPDCPALEDEAAVEGPSRVEPNGSVIIVAPSVDRSLIDEIIGTREHTYPMEIPVNQFDVEVV